MARDDDKDEPSHKVGSSHSSSSKSRSKRKRKSRSKKASTSGLSRRKGRAPSESSKTKTKSRSVVIKSSLVSKRVKSRARPRSSRTEVEPIDSSDASVTSDPLKNDLSSGSDASNLHFPSDTLMSSRPSSVKPEKSAAEEYDRRYEDDGFIKRRRRRRKRRY
jgi:hypothetical protein